MTFGDPKYLDLACGLGCGVPCESYGLGIGSVHKSIALKFIFLGPGGVSCARGQYCAMVRRTVNSRYIKQSLPSHLETMVRKLVRRQRRGQSGIEFLAITGIGMLLLLGVSFLLLSDSRTSRDKAEVQQADQIGSQIISQARIVQAQGRNSWVTVEAQVPKSVKAIYTVEDNTLVFEIITSSGQVSQPVFSIVPIVGWYYVGPRKYLYDPTSTTVGGGVMRFNVLSNGSSVVISHIVG